MSCGSASALPRSPFTTVAGEIRYDVQHRFARTLDQENGEWGSLIVVPAQAEPIAGVQNEGVAEPRQNDACPDRNELDIAVIE